MESTESKATLKTRLGQLKQHHDDLDQFFQQIERDVDSVYRNYKGEAIACDVIAALCLLSISAYRICVSKLGDMAKLQFAQEALEFAYGPIKDALIQLTFSHPNLASAQRNLSAVSLRLMTVANIIGNWSLPSYWGRVFVNLQTGHWKTAFTRNPAVEITQTQSDLRRQRSESLEAMERQINQMEKELGIPPTLYACQVI